MLVVVRAADLRRRQGGLSGRRGRIRLSFLCSACHSSDGDRGGGGEGAAAEIELCVWARVCAGVRVYVSMRVCVLSVRTTSTRPLRPSPLWVFVLIVLSWQPCRALTGDGCCSWSPRRQRATPRGSARRSRSVLVRRRSVHCGRRRRSAAQRSPAQRSACAAAAAQR